MSSLFSITREASQYRDEAPAAVFGRPQKALHVSKPQTENRHPGSNLTSKLEIKGEPKDVEKFTVLHRCLVLEQTLPEYRAAGVWRRIINNACIAWWCGRGFVGSPGGHNDRGAAAWLTPQRTLAAVQNSPFGGEKVKAAVVRRGTAETTAFRLWHRFLKIVEADNTYFLENRTGELTMDPKIYRRDGKAVGRPRRARAPTVSRRYGQLKCFRCRFCIVSTMKLDKFLRCPHFINPAAPKIQSTCLEVPMNSKSLRSVN